MAHRAPMTSRVEPICAVAIILRSVSVCLVMNETTPYRSASKSHAPQKDCSKHGYSYFHVVCSPTERKCECAPDTGELWDYYCVPKVGTKCAPYPDLPRSFEICGVHAWCRNVTNANNGTQQAECTCDLFNIPKSDQVNCNMIECSKNSDCQQHFGANTRCRIDPSGNSRNPTTCDCWPPTRYTADYKTNSCFDLSTVHRNCSSDTDCGDNGSGLCQQNQCSCALGYKQYSDGTCENFYCYNDSECSELYAHSYCNGRKCECNDSFYTLNDGRTKCVLKGSSIFYIVTGSVIGLAIVSSVGYALVRKYRK